MNTIRPTSVESIIPNRASGYTKNADGSIQNAPNYIALRPSGAFISDITDLLKWEMVMQTHKLLTQKSWSQMWDDTIKTPFRMDNFSDFAGNEPMFYGYGWMTSKYKGGKSIHHAGSMPGFKSVYFRYVEDNTAIIILTNFDKADTYRIAFGVSDLLQAKDKKK
jgi:CubicO group peptidase (beta-lactamase class C family)